jgi:hypothetical protein
MYCTFVKKSDSFRPVYISCVDIYKLFSRSSDYLAKQNTNLINPGGGGFVMLYTVALLGVTSHSFP